MADDTIFQNELNIESLISAPLIAASKANAFMLQGQYFFLINNCFDKIDEAHYKPKMIEMVLSQYEPVYNKTKDDTDFIKSDLSFNIPIICLIPFSSIAVDNVKIDFNMEITSVTSYIAKEEVLDKKAQLHGRISYDPDKEENVQNKRQNTSTLKVNINASKLPLPPGLLNIIDLYNRSISPVSTKVDSK